jgi:hypothetical protein
MKTRLEISISYTDAKGVKRYVNSLGNVWLDTENMRGSIDLPPGVSLHSQSGVYINVQKPRERDGAQRKGNDDEIPY